MPGNGDHQSDEVKIYHRGENRESLLGYCTMVCVPKQYEHVCVQACPLMIRKKRNTVQWMHELESWQQIGWKYNLPEEVKIYHRGESWSRDSLFRYCAMVCLQHEYCFEHFQTLAILLKFRVFLRGCVLSSLSYFVLKFHTCPRVFFSWFVECFVSFVFDHIRLHVGMSHLAMHWIRWFFRLLICHPCEQWPNMTSCRSIRYVSTSG